MRPFFIRWQSFQLADAPTPAPFPPCPLGSRSWWSGVCVGLGGASDLGRCSAAETCGLVGGKLPPVRNCSSMVSWHLNAPCHFLISIPWHNHLPGSRLYLQGWLPAKKSPGLWSPLQTPWPRGIYRCGWSSLVIYVNVPVRGNFNGGQGECPGGICVTRPWAVSPDIGILQVGGGPAGVACSVLLKVEMHFRRWQGGEAAVCLTKRNSWQFKERSRLPLNSHHGSKSLILGAETWLGSICSLLRT